MLKSESEPARTPLPSVVDMIAHIRAPASTHGATALLPSGAVWRSALHGGLDLRPDQCDALGMMQALDREQPRAVFRVPASATAARLVPSSRREYLLPRGGVLCETMGYGKTAVVLALVASTRGQLASALPARVGRFRRLPHAVSYNAAMTDTRSLQSYASDWVDQIRQDVIEPALVACACAAAPLQRDAHMKQCDGCLVWFHPACEPHDVDVDEELRGSLLCRACRVPDVAPPVAGAAMAAQPLVHEFFSLPLVVKGKATRDGSSATQVSMRYRIWRSAATLIVVPAALNAHVWLREWKKVFWQPDECVAGDGRVPLSLIVLQSTDDVRRADPHALAAVDVVLCTRESLRALSDEVHAKPIAAVNRVHWRRVIADEGHTAGNANTRQSQALASLHTDARWIISATPQTRDSAEPALAQLLNLTQFCGGQPWIDSSWLRQFKAAIHRGDSAALRSQPRPVPVPVPSQRDNDDDDGDSDEELYGRRGKQKQRPKVEQMSGAVKAELSEPNVEPEPVLMWKPIETDDELCRAAHEFLLQYINAIMIRHPPDEINLMLHQGLDRQTRFVQFKPHEQIAYNLHVLAVHANELTSRGTDRDSFVHNAAAATESFHTLLRSCTISSAFTHEQLAVLLFAVDNVLTSVRIDVPLRDDERQELHFVRRCVHDVIAYECVLLRTLAASLLATAERVAADRRTSVELVWQSAAHRHVESFTRIFGELPVQLSAFMYEQPSPSGEERNAFFDAMVSSMHNLARTVGVDGLLANRCLECGALPCGSKLDAAVEIVCRAVAAGQKVLVFSGQEDSQDVELLPFEQTTANRAADAIDADAGADADGGDAQQASPRARRRRPAPRSARRRGGGRAHLAGLMLDTLRSRLELFSVKCIALEEQRTPTERDDAIRRFQVDPAEHVLLLKTSTPAAVFGIDLHVASCVLFLGPSESEAIEVSAIARAARAGQTKRVDVTMLAVQGTCEEDMLLRRDHNMTSLELLLGAMPVPDALVDQAGMLRHYGALASAAQNANVKAAALDLSLQGALELDPARPPGLATRAPDDDRCTFHFTGGVGERQTMHHCFTCGLVDDALVCLCCARRCHVGHLLSPAFEQKGYCDCQVTDCCEAALPTPLEERGGAAAVHDALHWLPQPTVATSEPFCLLPSCRAHLAAVEHPRGNTRREIGRVMLADRRFHRSSVLTAEGRLPRAQLRTSPSLGAFLRTSDGGADDVQFGDLRVHMFDYERRVQRHAAANDPVVASSEAVKREADEAPTMGRKRLVQFAQASPARRAKTEATDDGDI
jgi:hypothetical protein